MAAGDLTTLENLKGWLPVPLTTTSDDDTLSRLITVVSADFMRATKRPDLLSAEYNEVHEGDGSKRMIAFHWPITEITSLIVGGVTISASADKIARGYYIDEDIDPERVWNIYLVGSSFTDGAAIRLEYSAGYETTPADIEQAVIEWSAYRYVGRQSVGVIEQKSTEGESEETQKVDAPENVLSVIDRYARKFPCLDRRQEEREERMARGGSRGKKR